MRPRVITCTAASWGSFHWFLRRRLRITLIGDVDKINEPAVEIHNQR